MATKSKRKKAAKTKRSKPAKAKIVKVWKKSTVKVLKDILKVMKSSKFVVSMPSPGTAGAVVSGTDPCTCGDAPEEHGRDTTYPGSTACTVDGCGCIAYEAVRGSDVDAAGSDD
jgi:hypothetical protein